MFHKYAKFQKTATQLRALVLQYRHAISCVVLVDNELGDTSLVAVCRTTGWLSLPETQTLIDIVPESEVDRMQVWAEFMNEVLMEAVEEPQSQSHVHVASEFARNFAEILQRSVSASMQPA